MKYLILFIILVLVGGYFILTKSNDQSLPKVSANFNELPRFFKALKKSNNNDSFLIINLADSEDFIQFKYIDGQYEIDFPLVTERQKSNEKKIRVVCGSMKLPITENKSTDSQYTFLDIYLNVDEETISRIVKELFVNVFSSTGKSVLTVSYSGIVI